MSLKLFRQSSQIITANPLKFFLLASIVFGVVFVAINPPFYGLDERAHYMRAYEVAQGKFAPTEVGPNHRPGAYLPTNLVQFVYTTTGNLSHIVNNPSPNVLDKHYGNWSSYKPYFHQTFSAQKEDNFVSDDQLSGTYAYNPIGYVVLGAGVKAGQLLKLPIAYNVYLTRLAGLASFIVVAAFAIKIIPRYKWTLAIVALLPVTLYQAATISVDGLILAATFLLFALFFRLREEKGNAKLKTAALITLTFLALTKLPYILFDLPLLFIRKDMFTDSKKAYLWKGAWVLVPLAAAGIWQLINKHVLQEVLNTYTTADPQAQTAYILHHPVTFVAVMLKTFYAYTDLFFGQMTGKIGNESIGLPLVIIALFSFVAMFIVVMLARRESSTTDRLNRIEQAAIGLTALGIVVGIALSLYLIYCATGATSIYGIQGRYFIPVLPLILVLIYPLVPCKLEAKKQQITAALSYVSLSFLFLTGCVYFLANL